jgi:hypothetical protein
LIIVINDYINNFKKKLSILIINEKNINQGQNEKNMNIILKRKTDFGYFLLYAKPTLILEAMK